MTRRIALGLLAVVVVAVPASGQDAVPVDRDACLRLSQQLSNQAEAQTLPDDIQDRIEELLVKLEASCDAHRFADAAETARAIRAEIAAAAQ